MNKMPLCVQYVTKPTWKVAKPSIPGTNLPLPYSSYVKQSTLLIFMLAADFQWEEK